MTELLQKDPPTAMVRGRIHQLMGAALAVATCVPSMARIIPIMEINNSLVEFYLNLILELHHDVVSSIASTSRVDYERDREEIRGRVRSEGMGFLTKTLPRLGKSLDKALSKGELLQFRSFKKRPGTQLPAFCWELFNRLFDTDGRERSDACPMVLKQLRQLLFVLYKLKLPYDEETANNAILGFIEVDASLPHTVAERLSVDEASILRDARTIVHSVLGGLSAVDIIPKHGPGSVATGESAANKRYFSRIVGSIEQVYPFTEYFCYNLSHVADRIDRIQSLELLTHGTAKVVLVPKDSRGPRIISCEPLENQWIQQGQMTAIVRHLEAHPLTRGHVNFTDQTVNRRLALEGSRIGNLSTLDMKEASDRVSRKLVDYLLPEHWVEALNASRSIDTRLPSGQILPLNKFAPMGSAVCFPVEALVFWSLCVSIVKRTRGVGQAEARSQLYVYGDDIICSSADQAAIRQYLPKFALKVNDDKSCTHGFFRESCGCDAYKGVDVTPTKISSVWSQSLNTENYESYVAYSNALYDHGYYGVAKFLESRIQSMRKTPFTERQTNGISFIRAHVSAQLNNRKLGFKTRFNKTLFKLQVRGWCTRPTYTKSADTGWEELLVKAPKGQYKYDPVDYDMRALRAHSFMPPIDHVQVPLSKSLSPTLLKMIQQRIIPAPIPVSMEAGVYTVPRRNRLQQGWIDIQ